MPVCQESASALWCWSSPCNARPTRAAQHTALREALAATPAFQAVFIPGHQQNRANSAHRSTRTHTRAHHFAQHHRHEQQSTRLHDSLHSPLLHCSCTLLCFCAVSRTQSDKQTRCADAGSSSSGRPRWQHCELPLCCAAAPSLPHPWSASGPCTLAQKNLKHMRNNESAANTQARSTCGGTET